MTQPPTKNTPPAQKTKISPPNTSWIQQNKGILWLIKLNILVIGFLFVLLLIKQVQNPAFKKGLSHLFVSSPSADDTPQKNRSAKIQVTAEKTEPKTPPLKKP